MKKNILRNESAVSPVLGAILIMAIGVTLLSTVQLNFVPVWNTQEELDHLKVMLDDFKVLKSGIESGIQSGTTSSLPLSMGFKYSPKMLVYNPKESAYASLDIQENTWAEIRYNEVFPYGMTDDTSIKNVTTSTITYALKGASNYNAFVYEHGLIRRNGSNYTTNSQMIIANASIYIPSVKPLGRENINGMEKRMVNIYPTSAQKNSVLGKNVWIILHTKPEYVNWWKSSLEKEGGIVKIADTTNGIVITYIDSAVIKMGEAYISTASKAAPAHASPYRVIKITPEKTNLPVDGITNLVAEVQDKYNNPVPNQQVSFNINNSKKPGNSNATAELVQNQALSDADGRASVILKTSGAGFYYIDASVSGITTTFAYPASSQGNVLKLYKALSGQDYIITGNLTDVFGNGLDGKPITFDTSEGAVNPTNPSTSGGNASTILNVTTATVIKLTNISSSSTTSNSTIITWDTINNIIVSAQSGYIFNSIEVPITVTTTGCVRYGLSPESYSSQICDTNGTSSSHSINLSGLQPSTAYYFKINSSHEAVNVMSTEYVFVTNAAQDTTPPVSITNLNYTSGSLYINWTWLDPEDADYDHVELYIDSNPSTTVPKGQKYYNAFNFRPNSMHTINIRTVDSSGNANSTWVNMTASTPSVFTYVFNFSTILGTVTDFNNAKSGSDGGGSAQFYETNIPTIPDSNYYTYVTGNLTTKGTVSNWTNMQSNNSSYATLVEEANTVNTPYWWGFNTSTELWTPAWSGSGGSVTTTSDWVNDGNIAGGIFSRITTTSTTTRTRTSTWTSPTFTWNGGAPSSASLYFDWKVQTYTGGSPGSYYAQLVRPDASTVQIYPTTPFSSIAAWSTKSNTSLSLSDFSQSGSYQLKLIAVLSTIGSGSKTVEVRLDNPNITLGTTTYSLDITTDTTSVPSANNQYLEINYSKTASDNYSVYVLDGSTWNSRGTLNSTTWTVFNYTLTSGEYNSGTPRVSYVDQNSSGATQGNLYIDYQRIHGFTEGTPAGYHLDITTDTTEIPEANTSSVLELKYTVSGGNFTVLIKNGTTSGWDTLTTLNSTGMPYRNITLKQDQLIPDGTFSGDVPYVPGINKYYVLVRYVDESPLLNGTLDLDYQRVYSS